MYNRINEKTVPVTKIHQPKNADMISHKTLLKHFITLRHVSILSYHHQGALFLAKVIVYYTVPGIRKP